MTKKWVFFFDECEGGSKPPSGYLAAPSAEEALQLLGNAPNANVVLTWDEIEMPGGDGPVWFLRPS